MTDLGRKAKTMGEEYSFQQMVLEQDSHLQKNKYGPSIHKN